MKQQPVRKQWPLVKNNIYIYINMLRKIHKPLSKPLKKEKLKIQSTKNYQKFFKISFSYYAQLITGLSKSYEKQKSRGCI